MMWRRGYSKSDSPRSLAAACDIEGCIAAVGYSIETLLRLVYARQLPPGGGA
jgi:hypothetical protein